MRTLGRVAVAAACGCFLLLPACGGADGDKSSVTNDHRFVSLDLERRATDELVGYYMGAFVASRDEDAFDMRLVVKEGGHYFVDVDRLAEVDSAAASALSSAAGPENSVEWESFRDFVSKTYFRVRQVPPSRSELDAREEFSAPSSEWMQVETIGVMSTQPRRVYVRIRDVMEALRSYRANEDRIVYPAGTVFIGEHMDGSRVSETTVMRKSVGGYWDFFAYDSIGVLVDSTLAMPRSRQVPTQCFGCHFGDKLYEPERSFPGHAPDGPHGPRELFVDDDLRDPEVVRYFDEHRQRSDGVLGLYATLLVSSLRDQRRSGQSAEPMQELLESLGL